MSGLAGQHNVATDDGTGKTTWFTYNCASWFGGNIVQGVGAIDGIGLQNPTFENLPCTFAGLFGTLEEKQHFA